MSDDSIQLRVIDQIRWEPGVDCSQIGVTVSDGVVTLHGEVETFVENVRALNAAKRTRGVKGVANNIEVRLNGSHPLEDSDTAKRLQHIFQWNVAIPDESVKIDVANGHVTLSGEVDWDYQRQAAEKMVWLVGSVRQVTNHIRLKDSAMAADVGADITAALKRQARLDANDIAVSLQGSTVVLSGTVKSVTDRRIVEKSVWSAPGVRTIINKLTVTDTEPAVLFPLAG